MTKGRKEGTYKNIPPGEYKKNDIEVRKLDDNLSESWVKGNKFFIYNRYGGY